MLTEVVLIFSFARERTARHGRSRWCSARYRFSGSSWHLCPEL